MKKMFGSQIFHLFIKVIGVCVIAFSVMVYIANFMLGDQIELKSVNKTLGSLGEYGTIAAISLWFLHHIWLFLHKNKISEFKYMKELYMLAKKYHMFIGYAVLAVATTHGVYFFIKGSHHMIQIYSGIFAFCILVLLSSVGILLNRSKNINKSVLYRNLHQMIAILFGLGLIIHLML